MKTIALVVGIFFLFLFIPSCDRNSDLPEVTDQVFYIAENSEKGDFVGHVNATDLDDQHLLSYEIVGGNADNAFTLESTTGNLFVNNPEVLDYEKIKRINLQVEVSDNHPNDPLESTANISVVLENLNEFAPVIEELSFSVKERCRAGTVIGNIVATDTDSGQVLSYRIESGNENQALQLDSVTGLLAVNDSTWFNYSMNQKMVFMVSVCDNDPVNPFRSYAMATIDVEDIPLLTIDIAGYVQKGPFISGASITISELNSDLEPSGRMFSTQIENNSGRFILPDVELESRFIYLKAEGFYFNERTGDLSEAQLILNSLVDIADSESFNVNVLTHLEMDRITFLMSEGMDFKMAKEQARNDILGVFNFESIEQHTSEQMDIASEGDDNAMLLALSVILQGYRTTGEFSELLSLLSQDIREDGILDSESIGADLINGVNTANLNTIRQFTEQRYSGIGMEYEIPEFEKYVKQFISQTTFVATNQLLFPKYGTYGDNVLHPEVTFVEHKQLNDKYYSLAVEVPEGRSFQVKIIGAGSYYAWGSLVNMNNYHENEPVAFATYTTTSTGLCDAKVSFLLDNDNPSGMLTFEYYSDNKPDPFFSKEVEIYYDSAPVD